MMTKFIFRLFPLESIWTGIYRKFKDNVRISYKNWLQIRLSGILRLKWYTNAHVTALNLTKVYNIVSDVRIRRLNSCYRTYNDIQLK